MAETVRRWLDRNDRNRSPKYILGESYGGFRGPRLARVLLSQQGVGVSGLILVSPLLDTHTISGYADPMGWVDLLPSEVAVVRAQHGWWREAIWQMWRRMPPVITCWTSCAVAVMSAAIDRLTARVAALTGSIGAGAGDGWADRPVPVPA